LIVDEDADRRRMLRTKVKQGVAAAETLKKRIREINLTSRSALPAATTTASSPPDNRNFALDFI
jgi:hypothetical protein